MSVIFQGASSRGFARHDWLSTHHSFSFASYYDPARMGFGALRVLNDDVIAPGAGFGKHPHKNMEIITIPLSGALKHEDSMGNSAVVKTGEIQVMSAGTGVEHAEYNASETEPLSLLQIWIATNNKGVSPRYDQKRFEPALFHNTFFEVVGSRGEAPLGIYQNATLSLGRFAPEEIITYTMKAPGNGTYFFVIEGQALHKRDALGAWEQNVVSGKATQDTFLLAIEIPMTYREMIYWQGNW